MSAKYKIGYIDEDNNQVKLYSRKLRDYDFEVLGYNYNKGMTLDELMNQVYDSDIDLLMIDFRLNESNIIPFNGDEVERHIYEKKPLFPHIIFTNKVDQAEPAVDDLKIIFDKESLFPIEGDVNENTVKHFVSLLTKSIEQYRKFIDNKKTLINNLLDKEKDQELTSKESDDLLTAQKELQYLDKSKTKVIPEQLATINNLEKLSKARKEAENYINALIKKNNEGKE